MAQWLGAYTGHTHRTKVKELELTLQRAVAAFRVAESSLQPQESLAKKRAVQKVAEKLVTARLKLLKAQLDEAEPAADALSSTAVQNRVTRLRLEQAELRAGGVGSILREFDAL